MHINDLFKDPSSGVGKAQGVLSHLFRGTLLWAEITAIAWNRKMNALAQKDPNLDKGNLNKGLASPDMCWKAYLKGMRFLDPLESELTIQLTFKDGSKAEFVIDLKLGDDVAFDMPETADLIFTGKPPGNVLTQIWRKLVSERLTAAELTERIATFVKEPRNGFSQEKKEVEAQVNYFTRQLMENKISWNTMRRGFLVLGVVDEIYSVKNVWSHMNIKGNVTVNTSQITDPFFKKEQVNVAD